MFFKRLLATHKDEKTLPYEGEPTPLFNLPNELWVEIFDWLPIANMYRIKLVCRHWRSLAEEEILWHRRLDREYAGTVREEGSHETYQQLYAHLSSWRWEVEEGAGLTSWMCSIQADGSALNVSGNANYMVYTNRPIPLNSKSSYYFTFTAPTMGHCLGIGFTDASPKHTLYTESNNGIGWYTFGSLYNKGRACPQVVTYTKDDNVSVLLDMKEKKVHYYKNGIAEYPPQDISWIKRDLRVSCLLSPKTSVSVRYRGSKKCD